MIFGKTNKVKVLDKNNIIIQDVSNSNIEIYLNENEQYLQKLYKQQLEKKYNFSFLIAEDIYERSLKAHEEEKYMIAYSMLRFFIENIQIKKVNKIQLDLLAKIFLLFSNVLMQLGIRNGPFGAFHIATTSLKYYKLLNDIYGQCESCHIIALCYRQMCAYSHAQKLYFKSYKLIQKQTDSLKKRMHILHDIAENSFLFANKKKDSNLFEFSNKCFKISNNYFKNENPHFYNIALIKTADLYIKENKIKLCNDFLEPFEDNSNFNQLSVPFKAIYLRTNAERYFAQNNFEKGLMFFKKAIKLNRQENYQHQMEELLLLRRTFADELIDVMPMEYGMFDSELFSI